MPGQTKPKNMPTKKGTILRKTELRAGPGRNYAKVGDVKAGDRIRYEGDLYTIAGAPRHWKSATGRLDHIMLSLERWRG